MYNPPSFNLSLSIWLAGNSPSLGGPDVSGVPGQHYINSRIPGTMDRAPPAGFARELSFRIPTSWAGAFVQPFNIIDFVGSHYDHYFVIIDVLTMHAGFPNEYLAAIVGKCLADGTPYTTGA